MGADFLDAAMPANRLCEAVGKTRHCCEAGFAKVPGRYSDLARGHCASAMVREIRHFG
jgi:hypothetical protein